MSCIAIAGAVIGFASGVAGDRFFPEVFDPAFKWIKDSNIPGVPRETGFFSSFTSRLPSLSSLDPRPYLPGVPSLSSLDPRNLPPYLDPRNLPSAVVNHPYIAATVTVTALVAGGIAYRRSQEA